MRAQLICLYSHLGQDTMIHTDGDLCAAGVRKCDLVVFVNKIILSQIL